MADINAAIKEVRKEIALCFDSTLNYNAEDFDNKLLEQIEQICFSKKLTNCFSVTEIKTIIDTIFNQMRRNDVIEPLIKDPNITEIMVNGPNKIFVEKNGVIEETEIVFESPERLDDLIQNIVARVNRSVNEANPVVDARLEDGSRVNVVLPPIALNGPLLTIRKFPENPMRIDDLIRYESITPEVASFLERLVKAKYNIFICGGTGSGKTSFLNVLSSLIPKEERIITIEDSAELQLHSIKNIARMETRNANTEGKGEIGIKTLIKTSLRMRPERVIVGEVRGQEALDMLQAMNTGHDGSMSTGHANSTHDMLSRLETMVLMAAPFPLEAIKKQIASAIDIIILLSRLRDHTRRVIEITEVLEYKDGEIELNRLFEFEETGEDENARVLGCLKRTANPIVNTLKSKRRGICLEE